MGAGWGYDWDDAKRRRNLDLHGVDFAEADQFEWAFAVTFDQTVGGERRQVSFEPIGNRLHVMVWTLREDKIRIISLRKANSRERDAYDQA